MVRIVLDTNQVGQVCRRGTSSFLGRLTLVLNPHRLAEILLSPQGAERLRGISEFPIRFGVDPSIALATVASGTDAQALSYKPFYPPHSQVHRVWRRALKVDLSFLRKEARRIKDANRDGMRRLCEKVRLASKRLKDERSRGESPHSVKNLATIEDGMQALHAPNLLGPHFLRERLNAGSSKDLEAAASHRLVTNPYTNHFLRFLVTLHLGYGDAWADPALNVSPSPNRDDVADMLLTLYANDGDIIVTGDKKFRRAYEFMDIQRTVKILTWTECMEFLTR